MKTLELNKIHCGDCIETLKQIESNSVDSIVTDPPYELGFMGKKWDSTGIANNVEMWQECLRVLKPGGHLLAFSGTRTYHRMAVAIEDAGFEIRDMIEWVYGSGFPKSLNVGKSVNQLESNEWTKISKALDNLQITDIIRVWKSNSNNVNIVAELSQRQVTAAGTHTDLNDSVLLRVVLPTSQEKQNTSADTVGIALSVHQATHTRISTVLQNVVAEIKQLQEPVKFAEKSLRSQNHKHSTTSTVQESVKDTPSENTANKIRVEEALKTLRGKRKYSDEETINVLCAVLTENLLHTILSQSKTFQNLDTTSKTECVSAITVTITEYTAECLTTYTVDIAKSKAVDKLQGNEREVVGKKHNTYDGSVRNPDNHKSPAELSNIGKWGLIQTPHGMDETKGTSEWEGWGTALKPSHEPICMARKPLSEKTVAENCLKWGTGGINIDESRVGGQAQPFGNSTNSKNGHLLGKKPTGTRTPTDTGRFPANLIHDNSEEVRECFPETKTGAVKSTVDNGANQPINLGGGLTKERLADSGNASRFFKSIIYQAKASKSERNRGCEEMESKFMDESRKVGSAGGTNPRNRGAETKRNNFHPTVKPIALMEYLIKMVTPKGGIVLDPFAGSGTTGVACKNLNRNYILIEKEQEYCKIAEARIKNGNK